MDLQKIANFVARFGEDGAKQLVNTVRLEALGKLAEAYFKGAAEANQDLRCVVAAYDLDAARQDLEGDSLFQGSEKMAAMAELENIASASQQLTALIESVTDLPIEKNAADGTSPERDGKSWKNFFTGMQPGRERSWKKLDIPPSDPAATCPDRL